MGFIEKISSQFRNTPSSGLAELSFYALNYDVGEALFQGEFSQTIDSLNKNLPDAISQLITFDPLRYQHSTFFGSAVLAYTIMFFGNIAQEGKSEGFSRTKSVAILAPILAASEIMDYYNTKSVDWKDYLAISMGLTMFYLGDKASKALCDLWEQIFSEKSKDSIQR